MLRYRLDELGWYQFEWLCQVLLKRFLGDQIEAWGGSGDWGRDAYCRSAINFAKTGSVRGPHVFQCKFVEEANAAGAKPEASLMKAVKAECKRINERKVNGTWKATSIILLSNVVTSGSLRTEIETAIKSLTGCTHVLVWDGQDICGMLDRAAEVRQSFPQLLSVRDLELIIKSEMTRGTRTRSNITLERSKDLLPVFVATAGHLNALKCLEKHHFVMLSGPPEMGKTTIACIIGLQQAAAGWKFIDCMEPKEFFENFDETIQQIFFVDDLFGTTEYDPTRGHLWAPNLDQILRVLDKNHWFLFTCRTVPLKLALRQLEIQGRAEKFPKPGDVIVDTTGTSLEERALMLFKHAQHATLPKEQKTFLRAYAKDIVENTKLTPERIRRLTKTWLEEFTQLHGMATDRQKVVTAVNSVISRPTERMQKSIAALSVDHKAVLFSCLDLPQHELRPQKITDCSLRLFGGYFSKEPLHLINDLTDHFFCHQKTKNEDSLSWIHPSWRDAVIESLQTDRELRKEFIKNCSVVGMRLSISVGGGEEGSRSMPLLLDAGDVELFFRNLRRQWADMGAWDRRSILESILTLSKDNNGNQNRELIMKKLPMEALRWNSDWNASSGKTDRALITLFSDLLELLKMEQVNVVLWPAWKEDLKRLYYLDLFDYFDDGLDEHIEEWTTFTKWLKFLEHRRPELLQKPGRKRRLARFAKQFLSAIEYFVSEIDEPTTRSDAGSIDRRLQDLREVVEKIPVFFPSLEEEASSMDDRLLEKQIEIEEVSEQLPDEPGGRTITHVNAARMPPLDIDDLFAGL